ncbi:TerC family protein [Pseudomonas sp. LTJR-52]|uniref:TerC family protein n=1 Tax=Pseudomonas sp. LTJR-52 TaxID=2479392 RepID=UPI001C49ABC3|nr:TerC family protein [Pseudomonas sp. LTJR-52]
MTDLMNNPDLWLAVGQIILIDILLGGDNAVVIALACRKLPEAQRNKAILGGALGAILLRIVLIFFALELLTLPYLKLVGALLLAWIGVKLMLPEGEDEHAELKASPKLLGAIWTIIVADALMSLDNVVAVAGASHGQLELVIFGIVVSIPIIIWGSKLVLRLMERFPIIIKLGAALLGWIAGGMAVADTGLPALPSWTHYAAGVTGALIVVAIGTLLGRYQQHRALRSGGA